MNTRLLELGLPAASSWVWEAHGASTHDLQLLRRPCQTRQGCSRSGQGEDWYPFSFISSYLFLHIFFTNIGNHLPPQFLKHISREVAEGNCHWCPWALWKRKLLLRRSSVLPSFCLLVRMSPNWELGVLVTRTISHVGIWPKLRYRVITLSTIIEVCSVFPTSERWPIWGDSWARHLHQRHLSLLPNSSFSHQRAPWKGTHHFLFALQCFLLRTSTIGAQFVSCRWCKLWCDQSLQSYSHLYQGRPTPPLPIHHRPSAVLSSRLWTFLLSYFILILTVKHSLISDVYGEWP